MDRTKATFLLAQRKKRGHRGHKVRRYLFGALPIADAFIARANSVEASKEERLVGKRNWRWSFQLALVVVLASVGMMWGMRPRRQNS